jgi:hypothetical protein
MEYSGDKTLQDLADDGTLKYEHLSDTIELLAEVQEEGNRSEGALTIENVIDAPLYIDRHGHSHPNTVSGNSIYFINRLEDLFYKPMEEHYNKKVIEDEDLIRLCTPINNILAHLSAGFSKDSFRKNWVMGGDSKVVAIDFGTLRKLPSQIELVNILEGSKGIEDAGQIIDLIETYIDYYSRFSHEKIGRQQYINGYYPCAVQRHLELVGYSRMGYLKPPYEVSRDSNEEVIWHMDKARTNLRLAAESYPEIMTTSSDFDRHLANLENLVMTS